MLASKINKMNQKKKYIQDCRDCQVNCEEMACYLQAATRQSAVSHVELLRDCAAICQASADFMASDSDLQYRFCGACTETCLRCAQMCERFGSDLQMKACADACRRCAESCRQMTLTLGVTPVLRPEWIGGSASQTYSRKGMTA